MPTHKKRAHCSGIMLTRCDNSDVNNRAQSMENRDQLLQYRTIGIATNERGFVCVTNKETCVICIDDGRQRTGNTKNGRRMFTNDVNGYVNAAYERTSGRRAYDRRNGSTRNERVSCTDKASDRWRCKEQSFGGALSERIGEQNQRRAQSSDGRCRYFLQDLYGIRLYY